MKTKALLFQLFLLFFGAGVALAGGYQNVDSATAVRLLQQRGSAVQLLDVRTPQEFFQARLEGAKLLSIHQPEPVYLQRLKELPRGKAYLVYCTVGSRSSRVADDMARLGFPEVYNLAGGIAAWYRMGYPILQGAP